MNPAPASSIALTGHTSGIGMAIHDRLVNLGFEVRGFSRSSGYDITSKNQVDALLAEIGDCSIFINNAAQDWAQIDLLYRIFDQWKELDKLIINIGSNSGDGNKSRAYKYAIEKAALDKATSQLNNIPNSRCRVTTIRPGWVKTPRIAHLENNEAMLDAIVIAGIIEWIVKMPKHIHIPNLTVVAKN